MATPVLVGNNHSNTIGVQLPGVDRPVPAAVLLGANGATSAGVKAAEHGLAVIPAASLTSTSFAEALANSSEIRILLAWNTTDEDIYLSVDAGSTETHHIPAGASFAEDYTANALEGPSAAIHYKVGSTPTTGALTVKVVY